eukprot:8831231-Pyramimonas_sp.AAC.1
MEQPWSSHGAAMKKEVHHRMGCMSRPETKTSDSKWDEQYSSHPVQSHSHGLGTIGQRCDDI